MTGPDPLWMGLIASLQASAMMQLGKVVHPLTGNVERDLAQAKDTIDLLTMLERKCQGNLTAEEQRFLEHALFELRMNYLDESERPDDAASSSSAEADRSSTRGGGEGVDPNNSQ
ncbi:MAG: DUF1844 domain-containing protein [Candidatus Zixiibacteriota bacterium]